MSQDLPTPVCFRCGGPADQLNELEDDKTCPACAERLLDRIDGIFHAPWGDSERQRALTEGAVQDSDSDEEAATVLRGPRALDRDPMGPRGSSGPRPA